MRLSLQPQVSLPKLIMCSGIGKGVIGGPRKNPGEASHSTDVTKASSCGLLLKTKGFKVYHVQIHVEETY